MRTRKNFLVAFSFTLGAAVTALGQGGAYSSIDFPGASQTLAWGMNKSGDIVGSYTLDLNSRAKPV